MPEPAEYVPPRIVERSNWCDPTEHRLNYRSSLLGTAFTETWSCVDCPTRLERVTDLQLIDGGADFTLYRTDDGVPTQMTALIDGDPHV